MSRGQEAETLSPHPTLPTVVVPAGAPSPPQAMAHTQHCIQAQHFEWVSEVMVQGLASTEPTLQQYPARRSAGMVRVHRAAGKERKGTGKK